MFLIHLVLSESSGRRTRSSNTNKAFRRRLAQIKTHCKKLTIKNITTNTITHIIKSIYYQNRNSQIEEDFVQNLPTPKDYTLGPGDEIIISLYGAIQQNFSEIINRDGEVFLKDVGTLNLSGMSIEIANEYVKNKYSKIK